MSSQQENPFINKHLLYDDILNHLIKITSLNPEQNLQKQQVFKYLNDQTMHNGFDEFNYNIAAELFDYIAQQQLDLSLENLAAAFFQADRTLIDKYQIFINDADYFYDSLQFIEKMEQILLHGKQINSREQNYIRIDEVQFHFDSQTYNQPLQQPTIILRQGPLLKEQILKQSNENIFSSQQQIIIPVNTFLEDLSITIIDSNESNNSYEFGNIILPIEYLPLEAQYQTEFQVLKNNQQTHHFLMVSCQVVINNIQEAMHHIADKKNKLLDLITKQIEELEIIESQMQELRKPFILQNDAQVRFTVRDTYKEYPIPQRITKKNNDYEASQEMEGQKRKLQGQNDIFSYNTVQQQQSIEQQIARQSVQNISWRTVGVKGSFVQGKEEVKPKDTANQNQLKQLIYFSRVDVFACLSLIFCMFSQFKRSDFYSVCILLIIVLSIMMKKLKEKKSLIMMSAFIGISIFNDILWLIVYRCYLENEKIYDSLGESKFVKEFSYFMSLINLIIKLATLGSSLLLLKPENLSYLKKHLLLTE